MEQEKDYRISFFKPTTDFSRINRNLVIVLVLIWAIAIFGFQTLLRVMQKPTPETALITFESVWDNVNNGTASEAEKIEFTTSLLAVLGKSSTFSRTEHKAVLNSAFSWIVYDMLPLEERAAFKARIADFEKQRESLASLSDNLYVTTKAGIIQQIAPLFDLQEYSLEAQLIPLELRSAGMEKFTTEDREALPAIMSLYLTHNQSVLTDTNFLGFPFHYFYTAVFLLILFVCLCWVYCFIIDRVHTKMGNFDKPVKS
ncbi:MAG: DUF4212 domain-containing protein [Candidatus Cloacimonetes bacterium]|nr:DUF4212 domain-containing protein [Candidatus Cloacimonadota bacterium]